MLSLYPTPYIELYYVLAYLNFILEFYSSFGTARSAQTHKSISFIWIVWSTLYVYLWLKKDGRGRAPQQYQF